MSRTTAIENQDCNLADVKQAEDSWQRLQSSKPELHPNVESVCHVYRGQRHYLLINRDTNQQFRCSEFIKDIAEQLDGEKTVDMLFQELSTTNPAEFSREKLMDILWKLAQAGLMVNHTQDNEKKRSFAWLANPFAIKVPLFDPDSALEKLSPLGKFIFCKQTFIFWLLLIAWAALNGLSMSTELSAHWTTRFYDPMNLLWLWLIYPLVKFLHELGHGLATKFWGGNVREVGLMFLVFTPVPYVDASASAAFISKYQRLTVAAIGIMVELSLAAAAFFVWEASGQGLVKDLAFNVIVISGFSTLLFNGNPLLRFDGYYVLSDWIEIPNLATRSNRYLAKLIKLHCFGLTTEDPILMAPGEKKWLIGYGLLSNTYRVFITFAIVAYIADKLFIVGSLLAVWALYTQLIRPIYNGASSVIKQSLHEDRFHRVSGIMAISALCLFCFIFIVPISSSSYSRGIVMLPEESLIRANADGFVREIHAQDSSQVSVGSAIFLLENRQLEVALAEMRAEETLLQARYHRALSEDPSSAGSHRAALNAIRAEKLNLQEQLSNLQHTSSGTGKLSLANASDLQGRFVSKGDLIAKVISPNTLLAKVAVEQNDIDLIRRQTTQLQIRLASDSSTTININSSVNKRGFVEIPSASTTLPTRLLGTSGGGKIRVDASDPNGTLAIEPFFQLEIPLSQLTENLHIGQQVMVRFIHRKTPLANRIYHHVTQRISDAVHT